MNRVIASILLILSLLGCTRQTNEPNIKFDIGASLDEVRYLLGYPDAVLVEGTGPLKSWYEVIETDKIPKGRTIQNYNRWVWDNYHQVTLTVEFESSKVKEIQIYCLPENPKGCYWEFSGVQYGFTEEEIVKQLGKPLSSEIESTTKTLTYTGMTFYLTKDKVYMVRKM